MTYTIALERFPAIRQSRLATFDRCALSASFEEDYAWGWSTHPQARGTIAHRVFAQALRQMYELGENTIPTDAAIAILDEQLRQTHADRECPECSKPIVRRFMAAPTRAQAERGVEVGFPRVVCEAGHEHASDFVNLTWRDILDLRWIVVKWANENAFDIENLMDVEQRLRAEIRYPDEPMGTVTRELTGQLDAIFVTGDNLDEAVVLDWKDTWGMPGPTEVGFDGYFQQRFYAWLVFMNYPSIAKVTLREFYVRFGEAREAVVYRADLDDVNAELAALVERFDRAFNDGVFPPTPGVHCQFCPRPAACPIFPGVRAEGTITDAATAKRFGQEAQVARSALNDRLKAMGAWATVHGPIELSNHKGKRGWGHREMLRTKRPTQQELEDAVRLNGGNPLSVAQVRALYKTSKGSRFELMALSDVQETPDDAALMSALQQSIERQS